MNFNEVKNFNNINLLVVTKLIKARANCFDIIPISFNLLPSSVPVGNCNCNWTELALISVYNAVWEIDENLQNLLCNIGSISPAEPKTVTRRFE